VNLFKHLRRINYYSARGPRRWWQLATDWWMILSLPCAIALSIVGNAKIETLSAEPLLTLRYGRTAEGAIRSWIERDPAAAWAIAQPLGTATIHTTQTERGWPLHTTSIAGPTTVKLTEFQTGSCTIIERPEPTGDAMIESFIATLDGERFGGVADAWLAGTLRSSGGVLPFIAQIALYWVVLFVTGIAFLQSGRGTIAAGRASKRRLIVKRLGRGVCPTCRYDLAGAAFPEYCPECGLRIWG
jgi:hypothetical protein